MKTDRTILNRYFQGECSEEEKEMICQWLAGNEKNKKVFVRERIRFDATVLADESEISYTPRLTPLRIYLRRSLAIASSVLLLIAFSYLTGRYFQSAAPQLHTIHTPAGNRTSILLPDGTQVWLNANSTLSYSTPFVRERTVTLDGEGYFEVTADPKHPFTVSTHIYTIEVLGTAFNVEAYSHQREFRAELFSGKIKLYQKGQLEDSFYLLPGEAADFKNETLRKTLANKNSYRWKDGLIILEDQSFQEIMSLLEKYFNTGIVIRNDKVKGLGYHGKFLISDGVEHALRVLQNDFRFTYTRDIDENIIYID